MQTGACGTGMCSVAPQTVALISTSGRTSSGGCDGDGRVPDQDGGVPAGGPAAAQALRDTCHGPVPSQSHAQLHERPAGDVDQHGHGGGRVGGVGGLRWDAEKQGPQQARRVPPAQSRPHFFAGMMSATGQPRVFRQSPRSSAAKRSMRPTRVAQDNSQLRCIGVRTAHLVESFQ